MRLSRRTWLHSAGLTSLAGLLGSRLSGQAPQPHADAHNSNAMGIVGRVSDDGFSPTRFLRSWNFSDLPADERAKYYRESARPDGSLLREYEIFATDREIEIAPGMFFPAWTFNGQVPGPTIRATEGDRVRVNFRNLGTHPHSIHFHGWHPPAMDGSLAGQEVQPGQTFRYR